MNADILDIAPFSFYVNRRFGRACHFHLHGKESAEQETSGEQVADFRF
jgi:hypothetical protein